MVVLPMPTSELQRDAAVSAAFGTAGERCMAVSVVVAVGKAGDPLVAALRDRLATLRVGPGTDPEAQMGPLITCEHRDKVASYLAAAERDGAVIVTDGRQHVFDGQGFFLGYRSSTT